jgi:peptidoglycan/xylan/chitin deacetylase (PgdA/CDA1 family)
VPANPLAAVRRPLGRIRRKIGRVLAGVGEAPAILMYHRVAAPRHDPWALCVTPDRFARQLEALKASRTLLPLDELVELLEASRAPPRATAITFDDGYADNALVAKPLLEQAGVPATIFLTSGFVGADGPFWWDELAGLVLGSERAARVEIEVGGVALAASWPEDNRGKSVNAPWRGWERPRTARQAAFQNLWRALQHMDDTLRSQAMAAVRAGLSDGDAGPSHGDLPMSAELAAALPSAFITVGGHGRTHTPLPSLPAAAHDDEIAGGRSDLTRLTGRAPSGFAYPHGRWDGASRAAVARAGYAWAVTSRPALVDPRRYDRYALPRMAVTDVEPAELMNAIATLGV